MGLPRRMPGPLIRSRDCMPPGLWQNRRMSSQIADTVAERLQQARERAGYGAADQVAAAFGWPDYAADESGERTLTPVRAKLYAHAFHVDLEWLLSGDGESASRLDSAVSTASKAARPT